MHRKQRQIRENLRKNRDAYWTEVAEKLEEAYKDKDMKQYYKLIKEAHGPQMASTTKGRQSLTGQHMKMKEGNERTTTTVELEARWVEHFRELFNQPGLLGDGVDLCLPAQQPINLKIQNGPFDIAELTLAIKDMNNDNQDCRTGWLRYRNEEVCSRRGAVSGAGVGNVQCYSD